VGPFIRKGWISSAQFESAAYLSMGQLFSKASKRRAYAFAAIGFIVYWITNFLPFGVAAAIIGVVAIIVHIFERGYSQK
jgi:hypothetical protein